MIADRIRHSREEKRYTQEYMAAQLGLNQSTYCRFESGEIIPSIQHLQQIAIILGMDIMNLVNHESNKSSSESERPL